MNRSKKKSPTCIVCGSVGRYRFGDIGQVFCTAESCGAIYTNAARREALYGTETERAFVRERDRGRCRYCGDPADHIDHVFPLVRGGAPEVDNLVLACDRCGSAKGQRLLEETGFVLLPIRGLRGMSWS